MCQAAVSAPCSSALPTPKRKQSQLPRHCFCCLSPQASRKLLCGFPFHFPLPLVLVTEDLLLYKPPSPCSFSRDPTLSVIPQFGFVFTFLCLGKYFQVL